MRRPTFEGTAFAVVLITLSVLLLSGADAVVKAVSADFSLWQIYFARSLFAVPLLVAIVYPDGAGKAVSLVKPWVLLRSLLLVAMWLAYYSALPFIDLSVAATALYTTPLFIALFSALLGKEVVSARAWIGIAIGFSGVLMVLRPQAETFSVWTLLPMLGAVFYALAAIVTRNRLSSESPLALALSLHLCLLVTGAFGVALIEWIRPPHQNSFLLGGWAPMGFDDWVLMAALGSVMTAVAIGVAKAYQIGRSAIVGTFDYCYLVFAAVWGIVFFSETLDTPSVFGIAMIVAAGIVVASGSRNRTA